MIRLIVAVFFPTDSDSAGQSIPPDTRNDGDAIKAVIAATTDAFGGRDAEPWVKFCTPDAQLVTVRGESMKGLLSGAGTIAFHLTS